jgi:hypothetical protein
MVMASAMVTVEAMVSATKEIHDIQDV